MKDVTKYKHYEGGVTTSGVGAENYALPEAETYDEYVAAFGDAAAALALVSVGFAVAAAATASMGG